MASISSPIGPTIDVVAKTISRSVISGGGGGQRGGAIVPVSRMIDPGALVAPPPPPTVNAEEVGILRKQISALVKRDSEQLAAYNNLVGFLQNQFKVIGVTVKDLGTNLNATNKLLQNDAQLEQQQTNQEVIEQKKAAESEYRKGAEGLLEKKIQAALMAPVKAIGDQLQFTLGNLMRFFGILFTGWLVDKAIQLFKADAEGNKKKFEDIKNAVIKNLFIAGGVLAILNIGIFRIAGKIASLSFKLGRFLLSNTIGKLFGGIAALGGKLVTATKNMLGIGVKAAPTGSSAGTGSSKVTMGAGTAEDIAKAGGKIPAAGAKVAGESAEAGLKKGAASLGGRIIPGLSIAYNLGAAGYRYSQGDIVGGTLSGLSAIPVFGWGAVGVDVAREFGAFEGTPLGKNEPPKTIPPKSTSASPPKPKPITPAKPPSPKVSTTPSPTVSSPQNLIVPQYPQAPTQSLSPPSLNISSPTPTTQGPNIEETYQQVSYPQAPIVPYMGQNNINNTNNTNTTTTSNISNNSDNFVYNSSDTTNSIIEDTTNKINVDVNQTYAPASSTTNNSNSLYQSFLNPEFSIDQKSADVNISPLIAQTEKMPSTPVVGPAPAPKPNVIYASSGKDKSANIQAPLKSGPASEVPFISSSNPDNFYLLYSQVQYNIVS